MEKFIYILSVGEKDKEAVKVISNFAEAKRTYHQTFLDTHGQCICYKVATDIFLKVVVQSSISDICRNNQWAIPEDFLEKEDDK